VARRHTAASLLIDVGASVEEVANPLEDDPLALRPPSDISGVFASVFFK
jgi:hypothetical protein